MPLDLLFMRQAAMGELHTHYPLPKGSRDYLNCPAVRCCPVVRCANGLPNSQHKQTFIILPRSRFRARTVTDECGKVHSTGVLLSGIVPYNTIKRNRTRD